MEIIKETSPHIRRKDDLKGMMLDVIIALLPVIVFALIVYQWAAVRNLLIPLAVMTLSEAVFVFLKAKAPYDGARHSLKENWGRFKAAYTINNFLVPSVSALIFGLIMPASTDPAGMIYFALIMGSLFGIIIGKLVFGGTGQNIFNPAAVGFVFSKLCFGSKYVYATNAFYDVAAGGTALGGGEYSLLNLFIGYVPGAIGEGCKIAILLGLVYLLARRAADWRVVLGYLGSFALLTLLAGAIYWAGGTLSSAWDYTLRQLLSGGLLFGAVYMATDPVTMPVNRPGRFIYGIILGVSTILIRLFGALPEGVAFSILIGNVFAPVCDYYKWATNKYDWKNLLAMGSLLFVAGLIIVWALCVEVF
jgi:Na+-translocating ferredoxin:NAD+ oxidoreductase subunit D